MKKAKVVAAIVLAAAVGTTAFAVACGDNGNGSYTKQGKEFNLADYAHTLDSAYAKENLNDYSESGNVHDAWSKATKKNYKSMSANSGAFVIATVENGSKSLYDIKNDKELFSGYYDILSDNYYYSNYRVVYYGLIKEKGEGYEYSYVGPDGKLLTSYKFDKEYFTSYLNDLSWSMVNSYYDENNNRVEVYSMSYYDESKEEGVTKYFSYSKDKDNNLVWKEIKEDEINGPEADSDYSAGTQLGLVKIDLVEELTDSENFPTSNYAGIEYTKEGNNAKTYTYYKNGNKISTLALGVYDSVICHVGNYVYYSSVVPVSADATDGYNYEATYNNTTSKGNYTLYRYDFINGAEKAEEVKTDYIIVGDVSVLYNYSSQTFDKVVVPRAIKKINGIAISGGISS